MTIDGGTAAGTMVRELVFHSHAFGETRARLALSEELPRMVILCRARIGLTQEQMAERLGTTELETAGIERGQGHVDETIRRQLVRANEDASPRRGPRGCSMGRDAEILRLQRKRRAEIRSEKQRRWGRPAPRAA